MKVILSKIEVAGDVSFTNTSEENFAVTVCKTPRPRAVDLEKESALGYPTLMHSRELELRGIPGGLEVGQAERCHGSGQRAGNDSPFSAGDHPDPVVQCDR